MAALMNDASLENVRNATRQADRCLQAALKGRTLFWLDRFTSAGRTCYVGPYPVAAARPAASFGYYSYWDAMLCKETFTSGKGSFDRHPLQKHAWLDELWPVLEAHIRRMNGRVAIVCWKSSKELQALANSTGATLLACNYATQGLLENKNELNDILRQAGVPEDLIIPSLIVEDGIPSFDSLLRKFGSSIVVQQAMSSGGSGTYFVHSEETLSNISWSKGSWRISSFVKGASSNITVLTLPQNEQECSVYVDKPSLKTIGLSEVGIAPGKSAGNDWAAQWPKSATQKLMHAARLIGKYLYSRYQFSGLWGIDAIIDGDMVKINEINPRLQGTTELSGVNQILLGTTPFLLAHLTTMAGARADWMPDAESYERAVLAGTEQGFSPYYIKLRNRLPCNIRFRKEWPGPGLFGRNSESQLIWKGPAAHPLDAVLDVGNVLFANAPAPGALCHPDSELGTLEGVSSSPVYVRPNGLTDTGRTLVEAAYRLIASYTVPVEIHS